MTSYRLTYENLQITCENLQITYEKLEITYETVTSYNNITKEIKSNE
jgi:hypothetical protein